MTIFAVISFCSFISNQELYGLPHFYSFILCKYTLLTTTKLVLFLFLANSYLLPNKMCFLPSTVLSLGASVYATTSV